MISTELLEKKLQLLVEYLDELRPIAITMSSDDILQDNFKYHTAERVFQLVVDTMIDINIHIIKESIAAAPDDLQSTFSTLADHAILPRNFADKIAPTVGLRNRVVHRYESLQRKTFVELLKENFSDFEQYLSLIQEYIEKVKTKTAS